MLFRASLIGAALVLLSVGVIHLGRDGGISPISAAQAATLMKSGTFPKATVTGAQTVTGVGFQPKAVIFFWTKQATQGFAAGDRVGMGFASGSANQRVVSVAGDNAVSPTNYGRRRSDTNVIILLSDGTPTLASQAALTGFTADGFTLNWTTNDGIADIIHYIALGGDEITNAAAGTFTLATGTGSQAITGVGFQPEFVMFLSSSTEAVNTNTAGKLLNVGFTTGAAQQGALSVCGRDGSNANNSSQSSQRTDNVLIGMTTNCNQDWLASLTSLDANGFTVNKSVAPAAATPVFYLALRGGNFKVGSFNQPAAAGNQLIGSVGFEPQVLFMSSFGRTASTAIAPDSELTIGAATGTGARSTAWAESQDVRPTVANVSALATKALRLANGPTTVLAEADLAGFGPNDFTLNWTTADATARQVLYWVAGGSKTTLGGGTDPANTSRTPGGSAAELDAFTFQTSKGTNAVTDVTVTLSAAASGGLSLVEITNDAGTVVYGSAANPPSDTVTIATAGLTATTTPTQYKVRITPKSHAAMPAPPGSAYSATGTVTGWTGTYRQTGSDAASATVSIDNLSPADVAGASGAPGDAQVSLSWTNPADADFSNVIVLRNTAAITDAPVEGSAPTVGSSIGTSIVRYTGSAAAFVDTGLANGTNYYYKIFSKDTSGNYSVGTATGPHMPQAGFVAGTSGTQIPTALIPASNASLRAAFTFVLSSGTVTVTSITVSETGTVNANADLSDLRLYYKAAAACSTLIPPDAVAFNGTGAGFDASQKATATGSMTVGTSQICVYATVDVGAGASDGQTLDLQISNPSTDVTLSSGTAKPLTPVAMNGTTTLTAAFGSSSSTLILQMADPAKNPTKFWLSGGVVWMKEGTDPDIALTSSRVTVTDLTFTNLSYPGTPGLVRARMTVKYVSPSSRQEYVYEKLFTASATPRR
ncbi:MAG: hypothetical protein RL272_497 [Candidatus Parcubacteria bacterium]